MLRAHSRAVHGLSKKTCQLHRFRVGNSFDGSPKHQREQYILLSADCASRTHDRHVIVVSMRCLHNHAPAGRRFITRSVTLNLCNFYSPMIMVDEELSKETVEQCSRFELKATNSHGVLKWREVRSAVFIVASGLNVSLQVLQVCRKAEKSSVYRFFKKYLSLLRTTSCQKPWGHYPLRIDRRKRVTIIANNVLLSLEHDFSELHI